jgi:2-amino-4-hydroxy-6-hydroxymethyldihydropteridine diphosphokinase/dihydropteroate synthase
MRQKMKPFAHFARAPLRPPQILPTHFRHACSCTQTLRVSRTQNQNRTFSQTAPRVTDSHPPTFKKYTLSKNTKPITGIDLPATMSAPASETPRKRTAYIALGSNMGDRIGWIEKACNEMDARGIHVRRTSSLWETEPMYVLDQDRCVNGACEVR